MSSIWVQRLSDCGGRLAKCCGAGGCGHFEPRTDVLWLGPCDLKEAVRRARMYVDAGADGVFLPGTGDLALIEDFVASLDVPVNVLASPTLTRQQLASVGVARISTGSLIYRAAPTNAIAAARAVRDGQPVPTAISYDEIQALHRRPLFAIASRERVEEPYCDR
ncbi:isocitrate lyase/phosphoenolpyruvate mutase family protein [Arthrobacter tecti]